MQEGRVSLREAELLIEGVQTTSPRGRAEDAVFYLQVERGAEGKKSSRKGEIAGPQNSEGERLPESAEQKMPGGGRKVGVWLQ